MVVGLPPIELDGADWSTLIANAFIFLPGTSPPAGPA